MYFCVRVKKIYRGLQSTMLDNIFLQNTSVVEISFSLTRPPPPPTFQHCIGGMGANQWLDFENFLTERELLQNIMTNIVGCM